MRSGVMDIAALGKVGIFLGQGVTVSGVFRTLLAGRVGALLTGISGLGEFVNGCIRLYEGFVEWKRWVYQ